MVTDKASNLKIRICYLNMLNTQKRLGLLFGENNNTVVAKSMRIKFNPNNKIYCLTCHVHALSRADYRLWTKAIGIVANSRNFAH